MKKNYNTRFISGNDALKRLDCANASKHTASTLKASGASYNDKDLLESWELIDRYCRIALNPEPGDYVFRAQILHQMGHKALAIQDLERALKLDPENNDANRRLLAWAGSHQRRMNGAMNLLRLSKSQADLKEAGKYIIEYNGLDCCIRFSAIDRLTEIEVLWLRPITINLKNIGSLENQPEQIEIPLIKNENDANNVTDDYNFSEIRHAWANVPNTIEVTAKLWRANNEKTRKAKLYLAEDHNLEQKTRLCQLTYGGTAKGRYKHTETKCRPLGIARSFPIVVVIPVYKDYETLTQCISSIKRSKNSTKLLVVLINDATPEGEIRQFLDSIQDPLAGITVIENEANLGFVGSVNAALKHVNIIYPNSDVILLNSDTLVPRKFADRLMEAGHTSNDIGTITPLSNNGEYTSFPLPFIANCEVSYDQVRALNREAYSCSKDVEDIPAGVGFCLYIKRDCLNAVGLLNEEITDGYLEDLDFSMKARANGLRNVCATGVFVGHYGARSFTTRKRALVVRNMKQIKSKFPNHSSESAAFIAIDPLHKYRCKLEASLIIKMSFQSIIIHSSSISKSLLVARVLDHRERGRKVLLLETHKCGRLKLKDPDGGVPQSLECDLSVTSDANLIETILSHQINLKIEFIDLLEESKALLLLLKAYGHKIDIFISKPTSQLLDLCDKSDVCDEGIDSLVVIEKKIDNLGDPGGVASACMEETNCNITEGRIRILPVDERALSDVLKLNKSGKFLIEKSKMWKIFPRGEKINTIKDRINMAIVDVTGCPEELRDIIALTEAFTNKEINHRVIVFGRTFHDISAMKTGMVFVKGQTCISEFKDQFEIHEINMVLSIPRSRSYYEEYDLTSAGVALPYGRFSYPCENLANSIIQRRLSNFPSIRNSAGAETECTSGAKTQTIHQIPAYSQTATQHFGNIILSSKLSSPAAAVKVAHWANDLLAG